MFEMIAMFGVFNHTLSTDALNPEVIYKYYYLTNLYTPHDDAPCCILYYFMLNYIKMPKSVHHLKFNFHPLTLIYIADRHTHIHMHYLCLSSGSTNSSQSIIH